MIPQYLNDLNLRQVFAPYTTSVVPYIQESTSDEHIVDSESMKISGFVSSTFGQDEDLADKYFTVENSSGHPYALLQIDNGLVPVHSTKKCDCAIADDTHLCLIEFKANATSNNPSTIKKNYQKAINQLSATINIFNTQYNTNAQDIADLRSVEAFVCFKKGYVLLTSSQMNYQVAFAASNNGIPLSFARKKVI